VESHVREIATHLVATGDEVDVITLDASPRLAALDRDGGIRVRRFRSMPVSPGVGSPVAVSRYLRAHHGDYDVVHVHNYQSLLPLAAWTAGDARLVITPHYHGRSPSRLSGALHRLYRPLGGLTVRRADRIICVSEAEKRVIAAHLRLLPHRLTVIPNGVDRLSLTRAEPFPVIGPVVLALGRLERYKRVDRTLAAMARLRHRAQLVVVGDGPARPRLERRAAALGLAREEVRFVGRVDDHDVRRWLSTARVLVTLSEIEAFGLTVVEGLVSGSRVLASDIPAHREVAEAFPDAPIRLVPADADADRLAAELDAILATPRPSAPIGAVDWTEVTRRTREVYLDVLSGPARTRTWGVRT
jgi:glycosyltransferase involved in cell wall biosynthesis